MSLGETLSDPEERFCFMALYCLDMAVIRTTCVSADCYIYSTVTIYTVWSELQYVYLNCTSCYQFSVTQRPICSLLSKCGEVDSNRTFFQNCLRNIFLMRVYMDGWLVGWRTGGYIEMLWAHFMPGIVTEGTKPAMFSCTMRKIYCLLIYTPLLILLLIIYN